MKAADLTMSRAIDEYKVDEILEAIPVHRQAFDPFLECRRLAIQQLGGRNYGNMGINKPVAINVLAQMLITFMARLAGGNPAAVVETDDPRYIPQAKEFEIRINRELKRMNLKQTLALLIQDMMLRFAVRKCGLETGNLLTYGSIRHQAMQPFVARVDLDNLLIDMSTDDWDYAEYIGDRYRIDLEDAKKNEDFHPEGRKTLQEDFAGKTDEQGMEPAANLGTTMQARKKTASKGVWVQDVYVPVKNCIFTMPVNPQGKKKNVLLAWRDWDGPQRRLGPYDIGGFYNIPSCAVPMSPTDLMIELHLSENAIWNKAMEQAQSQKTVFGARLGFGQDAKRMVNAKDRTVVDVADPASIKAMPFPGADVGNVGFLSVIDNKANEAAGNLRLLGGQGPQSDTATQDMILAKNSGVIVAYMDSRCSDFFSRIIADIGFYLWSAPAERMTLQKEVKALNKSIAFTWDSEEKDGNFEDYGISVDYASLAPKSASKDLQALLNFVNSIYGPLQEQFASQGGTLDLASVTEEYARLTGAQFISQRCVKFAGKEELDRDEDGGPRKPQMTQRNYTRTDRSSGEDGSDQGLADYAGSLGSAQRSASILAAQGAV